MPSKNTAILVGVGSFDDPSFRQLRFCESDVNELGRVLALPDIAGFDVLKLHTPDRAAILTSLERSASQLRPEDKLLFYFAGHGKRSAGGKLYLIAKDTQADAIRGTGVPVDQILEIMQESQSSQRVMILDCCHSGAVGDQFRGEINDSMQELARARGTCILAASTGIQLAEEREALSSDGKGNGIFTGHLVEGLESGSAAVKDADYVTVDSLYDFVFQRTVTTSKQTPMKWVIGSVGNIVIAKSSSGGWQSQKAIVLTEFNNLHATRLITGKLLDRIHKITHKNWSQLGPEERVFSDRLLAFSRKTVTLDELLTDDSDNRSKGPGAEKEEAERARGSDQSAPPEFEFPPVARLETPIARAEVPTARAETPIEPAKAPIARAETPIDRLRKIARVLFLTSLGPLVSLFLLLWFAHLFEFTQNTNRVLSAGILAYAIVLIIQIFHKISAGESVSKFNAFVLAVSLCISLLVVWTT